MKVQTNLIKIALLFAARKDTRFYLNGLHFTHRLGHAVLEASDGTTACWIDCGESEPFASYIVPVDAFGPALLKGVEVEINPNGEDVTLSTGGLSTNAKLISAKYPDFNHVARPTSGAVSAQYSPALLARFEKAWVLRYGPKSRYYASLQYTPGPLGPAWCVLDGVTMCVMPFSKPAEALPVPEWV